MRGIVTSFNKDGGGKLTLPTASIWNNMKLHYTMSANNDDRFFSCPDLPAEKIDYFNKDDKQSTCSEAENEEVDKILAELDDAVETPKSTADTGLVNQAKSINLSDLSDEQLSARNNEIPERKGFKHTEGDRQAIKDIALEFTNRGVDPILRNYQKYGQHHDL
jgi:hypothetical protein